MFQSDPREQRYAINDVEKTLVRYGENHKRWCEGEEYSHQSVQVVSVGMQPMCQRNEQGDNQY